MKTQPDTQAFLTQRGIQACRYWSHYRLKPTELGPIILFLCDNPHAPADESLGDLPIRKCPWNWGQREAATQPLLGMWRTWEGNQGLVEVPLSQFQEVFDPERTPEAEYDMMRQKLWNAAVAWFYEAD